MIRFSALDNPQESTERAFRRKLHKSFPRFVAYCGIRQACRTIPRFRWDRPYVLGLVVPEGADMDAYDQAAHLAAHGAASLVGGDEETTVIRRTADRWSKSDDGELLKSLAAKQRVVLVAQDPACVPDSFRHAADAVIQVETVRADHVLAAAKLCLGLDLTVEQAGFIATVPLPVASAALRRGRPVSAAIALMKEATVSKSKDVSGPTLQDLHGLGEAGDWGRELATDLRDWKAGRIGWADVDRGILLSGPPGTGKTTFAGALAKTCGVHLVLGSIGRWQARGHLGDMLKAMRAAFDEARKSAPSIIFLDEIDAVGDRDRFSDHNADYSTQVVAALLECIDGAEGREGVVVVGACNNAERLDAALVRAGRLDRHVRISLPDAGGRKGILRWHLAGRLSRANLSEVVDRTDGWTGASLEQLVRQARRLARRARRDVTVEDLLVSLPEAVKLSDALRRRLAVHEAGHAILALLLDTGDVLAVSISSSIVPQTGSQDGGGVTVKNRSGFPERTRGNVLDEITVRLGGMAAEEAILGDRSAGAGGSKGSDLHEATLLAVSFEASFGFGEGFAFLSPSEEDELFSSLRLDRNLQVRVDKVLAGQFTRARKIVERNRLEVERVAEALLEKGSLTGDELRDLVAEQPRLKLLETSGSRAGQQG